MHIRFIAFAALTLALGACTENHQLDGGSDDEPIAVSVRLSLSLAEIGADRIDYVITHPSLLPQPVVGSLDTSIFPKAPGDPPPVSFALILPEGTDYQLELSAYEADGDKICDGISYFDVSANVTNVTDSTLTCRTNESNPVGVIGIDISFQLNVCPVIDKITFTPPVDVGEIIYFQVMARDPDLTGPILYTWSTPSGPITDAYMPSASYTCTAPGVVDVMIWISDGDTPCDQTRVIQIACNVCGNGAVEGDEECDDGVASATCDADCTLAVCGDGTVNLVAGEVCDDAGESALCNADCTPTLCGDGVLNTTAGEFCDDGANDGTGPLACEPCAPRRAAAVMACWRRAKSATTRVGARPAMRTARPRCAGTAPSTSTRVKFATAAARPPSAIPTVRLRFAAMP